MKSTHSKLVIPGILCFLMLGCTKSLDEAGVEMPKEQPPMIEEAKREASSSAKVHQRVATIIQLNCQQNNQCKTIGVGVSPCGGFAKHYIYSTESTNVLNLKQAVKAFNDQQKLRNKKEGLVGICRFIAPPKTVCTQQRCLTANDAAL